MVRLCTQLRALLVAEMRAAVARITLHAPAARADAHLLREWLGLDGCGLRVWANGHSHGRRRRNGLLLLATPHRWMRATTF